MALNQTKTLKMMYGDRIEHISCPSKAKYEDCIKIAIERFEIPPEFKNYIQISNGSRYVFEKYTFEYFNMLFPSPEITFHLRVDLKGLLGSLKLDDRAPFSKLNNKRRNSDEYEGVAVTRQNCFMGSLAGIEAPELDQSKPKRQKLIIVSKSQSTSAVKKTSSRRSIRI